MLQALAAVTLGPALHPRSSRRSAIWAGALVTSTLTLLFLAFFWNRFVGLRSGSGNFSTGTFKLSGILPYRDYFTTATPLSTVKSWIILRILGYTVTALRLFDVAERTVLGLLIYLWLTRLFRAWDAALAATATIIVPACDFSDAIDSYNHDAIILAVAAGFAGTFILGKQRARTASRLPLK